MLYLFQVYNYNKLTINLSFLKVEKCSKKYYLPEIYQIWKQKKFAIHFPIEEMLCIIESFTKRRNVSCTNYLQMMEIYHFRDAFNN